MHVHILQFGLAFSLHLSLHLRNFSYLNRIFSRFVVVVVVL